jgi:hypothetical protein
LVCWLPSLLRKGNRCTVSLRVYLVASDFFFLRNFFFASMVVIFFTFFYQCLHSFFLVVYSEKVKFIRYVLYDFFFGNSLKSHSHWDDWHFNFQIVGSITNLLIFSTYLFILQQKANETKI